MTAQVSVIMAVYNCEKYVRGAINSVLAQDFTDFEFLILDDGSKDRSFEVVQEMARQDSRIRPLQNVENLGIAKSSQILVQASKAELIARIDADDEMLPGRLRQQVRFLEQNPDIAVVGGQYCFLGRNRSWDKTFSLPVDEKKIREKMLYENALAHATVMFRKSIILAVGSYREAFRSSEDYDLWLRVMRHYRICNLPQTLTRVRLSLFGMTLHQLEETKICKELALASYNAPDRSLKDLRAEIERRMKNSDSDIYNLQFYWSMFKNLIVLGQFAEIFSLMRHYWYHKCITKSA